MFNTPSNPSHRITETPIDASVEASAYLTPAASSGTMPQLLIPAALEGLPTFRNIRQSTISAPLPAHSTLISIHERSDAEQNADMIEESNPRSTPLPRYYSDSSPPSYSLDPPPLLLLPDNNDNLEKENAFPNWMSSGLIAVIACTVSGLLFNSIQSTNSNQSASNLANKQAGVLFTLLIGIVAGTYSGYAYYNRPTNSNDDVALDTVSTHS